MIKAVCFDLYGTLIDILTDENDGMVYESLSRYLKYQGIKIYPGELKRAYSQGVRGTLEASPEAHPEVDIYRIFSDIMLRYGKKRVTKSMVVNISMLFRSLTIRRFGIFNGVYDQLFALQKTYRLALVSDAQWVFAEPEVAMLGLHKFFRVRVLSSRFGFKKPDVRLFRIALQKLRIEPSHAVYVGDNPSKDMEGAINAGMKFVLFRNECRRHGRFQPDACFSGYDELYNIVRGLQ